MKPDLYTKAVLTVIATMLTITACNQYISPRTTVKAQAPPFAGLQLVSAGGGAFDVLDTRTGEIWEYATEALGSTYTSKPWKAGDLLKKFRLTKLGQPLAVEFQH